MDAVISSAFLHLPSRIRTCYDIEKQLFVGEPTTGGSGGLANEIAPGDVVYLWGAADENALYGWGVRRSEVFEDPATPPGRRMQRRSRRSSSPIASGSRPRSTRKEIRSRRELAKLPTLRRSSKSELPRRAGGSDRSRRPLAESAGLEALPQTGSRAGAGERRAEEEVVRRNLMRSHRGSGCRPRRRRCSAGPLRASSRIRESGMRGVLIGLGTGCASRRARLFSSSSSPMQHSQKALRGPPAGATSAGDQPACSTRFCRLTYLPPLTSNAQQALDIAFTPPRTIRPGWSTHEEPVRRPALRSSSSMGDGGMVHRPSMRKRHPIGRVTVTYSTTWARPAPSPTATSS